MEMQYLNSHLEYLSYSFELLFCDLPGSAHRVLTRQGQLGGKRFHALRHTRWRLPRRIYTVVPSDL